MSAPREADIGVDSEEQRCVAGRSTTPAPQQTLVTDGGQAAVSHGPCVKHRCCSCHRIFDSVNGTDCPHCSGSSICSSENREECQ